MRSIQSIQQGALFCGISQDLSKDTEDRGLALFEDHLPPPYAKTECSSFQSHPILEGSLIQDLGYKHSERVLLSKSSGIQNDESTIYSIAAKRMPTTLFSLCIYKLWGRFFWTPIIIQNKNKTEEMQVLININSLAKRALSKELHPFTHTKGLGGENLPPAYQRIELPDYQDWESALEKWRTRVETEIESTRNRQGAEGCQIDSWDHNFFAFHMKSFAEEFSQMGMQTIFVNVCDADLSLILQNNLQTGLDAFLAKEQQIRQHYEKLIGWKDLFILRSMPAIEYCETYTYENGSWVYRRNVRSKKSEEDKQQVTIRYARAISGKVHVFFTSTAFISTIEGKREIERQKSIVAIPFLELDVGSSRFSNIYLRAMQEWWSQFSF